MVSSWSEGDIAQLLQDVGPIFRSEFLREHPRDSVVLSTRLAVELLAQLGIPARALSVQAMVFNAPFLRRMRLLKRMPEHSTEADRWFKEYGAWSATLGRNRRGGSDRWEGHLVAVVRESWLWDLSIDQTEAPDKEFIFPAPLLLRVGQPFLKGLSPLVGRLDKLIYSYTAYPKDGGYRTLATWLRGAVDDSIVRRVLAAIRG